MSVSSVGGQNGSWYLARVFQRGAEASARRPSLQGDLQQLSDDLASGDLEAARSDLATITSRLPDHKKLPHAAVAEALQALGAALENGDLDAARQALTEVQGTMARHAADAPPPPPPPDNQDGGTVDEVPGPSLDPLARRIDLLA